MKKIEPLVEEVLVKALNKIFGSITYSRKAFEYGNLRNIRTFERDEVSPHELRTVGVPARRKFGIYAYCEGLVQLNSGVDRQQKFFEMKCRFYRIEHKWYAHFIQVNSEGRKYKIEAAEL